MFVVVLAVKHERRKNYSVDSNIPGPIAETVKSRAGGRNGASSDVELPPMDIDLVDEIDINVAELPPVDSPLPDAITDADAVRIES